jgi:hypothetical protein
MKKYFFVIGLVFMIACSNMDMPPDVAEVYQGLPDQIDYNKDVKKILSDKCFLCHGPDAKKQKADLRLDIASFAFTKKTESGLKAISPGSPTKSEVVHRILSNDPEYRMPSPESHLELTPYEKAVLIKWIDQGAEYKPHWAFVAPKKEDAPDTEEEGWVKNDIDKYILSSMEEKKLKPAAEADKETLIRRLSFDIRGISPEVEEIDAFVASKDPKAYEKLVDGYLASDHYGERMAAYWLDVARFADSHGYLDDKHRDMSPWREWVVNAYNRNLPFNDFVTWQMAGDLLPNPTKEQILATGFNRNHKQNSEAGIIEEEFRVEYVADRTNTLGTAMMAMTLGCAKCHDHKYDPLSQKEYYSLFAFFNSTFEKGGPNYGDDMVVPGPTLLLTSSQQDVQIRELKNNIVSLEKAEAEKVAAYVASQKAAGEAAISRSLAAKVVAKLSFDKTIVKDEKTSLFVNEADKSTNPVFRKADFGTGRTGKSLKYNDQTRVMFPATKLGYWERYEPFSYSLWVKVPEVYPLATIFYHSESHRYGYQGYDLLLVDNKLNFRLSHNYPHDAISVMATDPVKLNEWTHVAVSYDGSSRANGVTIYVNGKKVSTTTKYDQLVKNIRQNYSIHKGALSGVILGEKSLDRSMPNGEVDEFHIFSDALTPGEVGYLAGEKSFPLNAKRDSTKPSTLFETRKALCDIYDSVREVMVMGDLPSPRQTFVLSRGLYNSPGDEVEPATPTAILPFSKDLPKNRLGLSKWLFDQNNPLTARVAANRIWQLIFGKGLVITSDDFGSQGAMPTHPELLDHLAIRYRENGWDTKALMKYIFMSATYRQSSVTDPAIIKADPENKLLTRNPRYRYPAEMIRDNALAVSGLLSTKKGGPSVYPYQPEGLWEELSDKVWRYKYVLSTGEDLYRKSIYTVRKRTSVIPFMQIFDAPDRSVCTVKRQVSSSPMQSLAMLNDPQILEAARFVGLRMMQEGGKQTDAQLNYGFRLITGRGPAKKESDLMREMYIDELKKFEANPEKAKALLSVGMKPVHTDKEIELAAMLNTALALMNTDEFITRK